MFQRGNTAVKATPGIQMDEELRVAIDQTAGSLVEEVGLGHNDKVLIWHDSPKNDLVEAVVYKCRSIADSIEVFERDLAEDAELLRNGTLTGEGIPAFFDPERTVVAAATKVIIIRGPQDPDALADLPEELRTAYEETAEALRPDQMSDPVQWVEFVWPTQHAAEIAGEPYQQYFEKAFGLGDDEGSE